MLAFIPAFFLILCGLGVLLLSFVRRGVGLSWLISAIAALAAFGGVLALHWLVTGPVYLRAWNPVEPYVNLLGYQLDLISWPYCLALAALTVAVLFTSSARIEGAKTYIWGLNLMFGGAGILAAMAITPLTMILLWALIDASEFVALSRTAGQSGRLKPVVLSYAVQLVSLLLISAAMIVSRWQGAELNFSQVSPQAGVLLFLAAVLRLGMLPWNIRFSADYPLRRDFGALLRGIQPVTGLVLLARIPELNIPAGWMLFLKLSIALLVLYGVLRWLAPENEKSTYPYWAAGAAGLAVLSALNGFRSSSVVWGAAFILLGGVLELYSSRDKKLLYIPALAVLGLAGLPFTPAAGGWLGLADQPFSILTVLVFLIHLVLLWGFIRHLFTAGEPFARLDRWVWVSYPAGLLLLLITQWVVFILGWPGSFTAGVWWAGLVPTFVLTGGYFLFTYAPIRRRFEEPFLRWQYRVRRYFVQPLSAVLRGQWLVDILAMIYNLIGRLTGIIDRLLESEGGFLWVLFLLTLMVTVLVTEGGL
jgi:hypothetical protein